MCSSVSPRSRCSSASNQRSRVRRTLSSASASSRQSLGRPVQLPACVGEEGKKIWHPVLGRCGSVDGQALLHLVDPPLRLPRAGQRPALKDRGHRQPVRKTLLGGQRGQCLGQLDDARRVAEQMPAHAAGEKHLRKRVGMSQVPGRLRASRDAAHAPHRMTSNDQLPGQKGQRGQPWILGINESKSAVLRGIVERNRALQMHGGWAEVPHVQQGNVREHGGRSPGRRHWPAAGPTAATPRRPSRAMTDSARVTCATHCPYSTGNSCSVSPTYRHNSPARA